MKHCPVPVDPQSKLDQMAKTLCFNAKIKMKNTKIRATQKATSKKPWSESPTSMHVTDLCEALLQEEWQKIKTYMAVKVATHCWLVLHKQDNDATANISFHKERLHI